MFYLFNHKQLLRVDICWHTATFKYLMDYSRHLRMCIASAVCSQPFHCFYLHIFAIVLLNIHRSEYLNI